MHIKHTFTTLCNSCCLSAATLKRVFVKKCKSNRERQGQTFRCTSVKMRHSADRSRLAFRLGRTLEFTGSGLNLEKATELSENIHHCQEEFP